MPYCIFKCTKLYDKIIYDNLSYCISYTIQRVPHSKKKRIKLNMAFLRKLTWKFLLLRAPFIFENSFAVITSTHNIDIVLVV